VVARVIRPDLALAQEAAWRQLTSPGPSWSGAQRAAIVRVTRAALDDPHPSPPWAPASRGERVGTGSDGLPEVVIDVVRRLARHASTTSEPWYHHQLERGLAAVAYVELVAIVAAVAAVDGFFRAAGLPRPELPPTVEGGPLGGVPAVEPATLNWVPVVPPADRDAAVVQGLSAAPADLALVRRLAAAQYIPFDEMGDLEWNRGTLSRADMELVASRLSRARECFY
jgi:hypothetical protein